jgi:AcrR family transcriptional regulator
MDIRERIINEAFGLFVKFGIRSVTMDQIAGHLGMSKRTLYETFSEKNQLLMDGIEHFRKIMHTDAMEIINKSDNVIQSLFYIGKHGEEMRKSVNPLFFEDIRKYYPEIHSRISDRSRNKEYSIMLTLIRKGIKDGVFKEELTPEIVNEFWHEVMNIFMNEEIFPRNRFSQDDLFKNIIMPYFVGISTEKGKALIEKYFKKEINF